MKTRLFGLLPVALLALAAGCAAPGGTGDRDIVFAVASSQEENPLAAGKAAATAAKARLGKSPLHAVIIAEAYEDKDQKAKVLEGVCSVFGKESVYGLSTYGSFSQSGVSSWESVTVLAIGGKDVAVTAVCRKDLGASALTMADHAKQIETKLTAAGEALARQLPADARLTIVLADAHSPKNGFLVAGMQKAAGPALAVTGGSANKNAGQTFVYYKGEMLTDAAVGLALSGDFRIAMAGRQAKENDKVIATAEDAAREALAGLAKQGAKPAAYLAFDCAGRKGKLKNTADELAAIQKALGRAQPLFGTYNAGEIGPADVADAKPGVRASGVGWHVMVTAIGW